MKFTVAKTPFVAALQQTMRAIEKRSTLPILSCVALLTDKDTLLIGGTDLDREIIVAVHLEEKTTKGRAALNAATLLRMVKTLRDGAVFMVDTGKKADDRVEITCGTLKMRMDQLRYEDVPDRMAEANHTFTHDFVIPRATLSRMLTKTRICVSTEETRYYLNGVYFEVDGGCLSATATNGHRLGNVKAPLPNGAIGMPGVIVPRAAIDDMIAFTERSGEDITVSLSNTYVRFAFNHFIVTSKLIDGSFPDYRRVVPLHADAKIVVMKSDLISCVKRVSAIQSDRNYAIALSVAVDSDEMRLMSHNPDGEAEDSIGATFYEGTWVKPAEIGADTQKPMTELTIGFNAHYLLDIANHLEGDAITINTIDPGSPAIFRGSAPDLLYVQMPLRV